MDLAARVKDRTPPGLLDQIRANDPAAGPLLAPMLATPESRRLWLPRMAAHGTPTMREYLRALLKFTFNDRISAIRCPTLVTEAENDFAAGQSQYFYNQLTCAKQFRQFTSAEGAAGHIKGLAQQVWTNYVFDWLADALPRRALKSSISRRRCQPNGGDRSLPYQIVLAMTGIGVG